MPLFAATPALTIILLLWFSFTLTALVFHLIPWLIIGLIAGWVAGAIVGSKHGVLGNIGLGLLGAVLGGFIFRVLLHQTGSGFIKDTLFAIVGAIVILLIGNLVAPSPRRAY